MVKLSRTSLGFLAGFIFSGAGAFGALVTAGFKTGFLAAGTFFAGAFGAGILRAVEAKGAAALAAVRIVLAGDWEVTVVDMQYSF